MKTRRPSLPCTPENVLHLCAEQGFSISGARSAQLADYLSLLMKWNKVMNLVGARSWESCLDNLIVDSLHLATYLESQEWTAFSGKADEAQIWDFGAGAGLPGIPLRIFWQTGNYWLVEAREKRSLFLKTVLARLALPRTSSFMGRVEAFMPDRSADLIISRAFMPWRDMLELVKGNIKDGGRVLFMTLSPLENEDMPEGWQASEPYSYQVGKDRRYFCSLLALPNRAPS